MPKNKDVDAWFARYDNPMKPVVERVREIILRADERVQECIKWQAPTFTYEGNLASFFPKSRQHASLMFHTGAQIPGKHPRLTGGGDTSRVMKIGTVAEANAATQDIVRIVKAWCDFRDSATTVASRSKVRGVKATRAKPGARPERASRKASKSAAKKPPTRASRGT